MADDLKELIPVLLDRINQGKVLWEALSGSSLVTHVGKTGIELSRERAITTLTVRDEEGRRLDTMSDSELSGSFSTLLNALYDLARRKALRVDETLETLKAELERL